MSKQTKYITQSTILARGWTRWAIDEFLGEPDKQAANPHYKRTCAPMRLYDQARVDATERDPEFVVWFARINARRSARVAAAAAHAEAERAAEETRQRHARGDAALRVELATMSVDTLLPRALDSMFALNRRAKHLRHDRPATARIYASKDAFLGAMVRAGRARVETFDVRRASGAMHCRCCSRSWVGDPWCYACGLSSGSGEPERWFVVDCGGRYRFHQPRLPDDLAALAVPVPAHEPTQPPREVPDIGISVEMQFEVVAKATELLRGAGATRRVA